MGDTRGPTSRTRGERQSLWSRTALKRSASGTQAWYSATRADIGLFVCLVYPSTAIFKKLGWAALLGYVALSALAYLAVMRVALPRARRLPVTAAHGLLVVLFCGLLVAFMCVHPAIDRDGFTLAGRAFGSADADDAIDAALAELLAGRYPYSIKTFLGNPISPLPGTLLLALPFYLLGSSALQVPFWLGGLGLWLLREYRDAWSIAAIAGLVLGLSPNVTYQTLQGIDYLANGVTVCFACAMLLRSVAASSQRGRLAPWLWALALGITLASRLNFLLVLPTLAVALARIAGGSRATALVGASLAAFLAITAPFYVADPAGFSPLHTADKLSLGERFVWAPALVPVLGALAATGLGLRRQDGTLRRFAADAWLIQLVTMLAGLALASLAKGTLDLAYPHFATLCLPFGLVAFAGAAADGDVGRSGAVPTRPSALAGGRGFRRWRG